MRLRFKVKRQLILDPYPLGRLDVVMAAKSHFSDADAKKLVDAARRIQERRNWSQEQLAQALGLVQPSVSAMLRGKWKPGWPVAERIAQLSGKGLGELLGRAVDSRGGLERLEQYPSLAECLRLYRKKGLPWSAWTIAAAASGLFGDDDPDDPLEWAERLTRLEATLKPLHDGHEPPPPSHQTRRRLPPSNH